MQGLNIWADYKKSFGSYVYDNRDKRHYLDFVNHYSSLALGYDRLPIEFYREINEFAHLRSAMGLYNIPIGFADFVEEFNAFAVPPGFTHVHFCCTGSLAVESAIKTAWAYHNYERNLVISMRNSFHGVNALGNFLTTSSRLSEVPGQLPGKPIMYWGLNVEERAILSSVGSYGLHKYLSAVIIEPVQCTYGDHYLSGELLQDIRRLCTEYDVPLIFDEVQTGFGTTGKVWYHEYLGIEPDIIVFGKKSQVAGILIKEKFAKIAEDPLRLSVTYDGDLMDMIRCKYVTKQIKKDRLLENITIKGASLQGSLNSLSELKNIRGLGGLIAFDLETQNERNIFQAKCKEYGLLVNTAGETTIRLRPHLAVTAKDMQNCFEIIKIALSKMYL